MGITWFTTSCSPADKIRMALCYRCSLSWNWTNCWIVVAEHKYGYHKCFLRAILQRSRPQCSCSDSLGQGWLSYLERFEGTGQCYHAALPPYSPELNPVENLWHYLRSHYWANRSYANYDDLRHAAIDAWRNTALDPEIIKSVCRTSYAGRIN